MDDSKMVRQANQIAQYFSVYPEERAKAGVRDHIRKFWEPRLRNQLINYAGAGGEDLHPLVRWAAEQLRDEAGQPV